MAGTTTGEQPVSPALWGHGCPPVSGTVGRSREHRLGSEAAQGSKLSRTRHSLSGHWPREPPPLSGHISLCAHHWPPLRTELIKGLQSSQFTGRAQDRSPVGCGRRAGNRSRLGSGAPQIGTAVSWSQRLGSGRENKPWHLPAWVPTMLSLFSRRGEGKHLRISVDMNPGG